MSDSQRLDALSEAGLVHPAPESVTAAPFVEHPEFFMAADKVQVKYEMLRAHVVDGLGISASAAAHGYSRAGFYVVASAFEDAGMAGLIDERPGRRGPLKMGPEIAQFIRDADRSISGSALAAEVAARFGVSLHRRTVERARPRP
jgi:transposase